uniref:Myelin and lymphocyte protein n=1 Tax=Oryctolagus cuniculus TaxID=9986 RepID=A0A5F9CZV7_RABIT
MAPAATGGSSLPSGFSVFVTFPDLLFIFEFVFGGLVWILVASSLVPLALVQGWVMFVSVFCFVATTALLVLYIIGAHGGESSWVTLVSCSRVGVCRGAVLVPLPPPPPQEAGSPSPSLSSWQPRAEQGKVEAQTDICASLRGACSFSYMTAFFMVNR